MALKIGGSLDSRKLVMIAKGLLNGRSGTDKELNNWRLERYILQCEEFANLLCLCHISNRRDNVTQDRFGRLFIVWYVGN
jgi:hypothetical protein